MGRKLKTKYMNLKLSVEKIEITPESGWKTNVEVEGVSGSEVLDHFSINEIISHFGEDKILNEIGESEVLSHFNIQE